MPEATRKEKTLWLLEDLVPGSGVNNLSLAFRVDGQLRPPVLRDVVARLLRRYEVLRTVFHETDGVVHREVLPADRVRVDVEQDGGTGPVQERLAAFVARPFHRDGRPLLRVLHLPDAGGDVCCIAIHHAISDVRSTALLRDAFVSCYDALASGRALSAGELAEVPAWREPEPRAASRRFWEQKISGFDSDALELLCEKPDSGQASLTGDEVTRPLSGAAREVVKRLQRELRAPESVVLLAAYYLLLAAHGAGPDLVIGSPVNVRTKEAAQAIGDHNNLVALRVLVDRARGFRELTADTRRMFLEAMAHADCAADELLEVVPRSNASWRNVLFRHVFNYVPVDGSGAEFTLDGKRAELLTVENGSSQFDLEFFITSAPEQLRVRAVFYTGVLDRQDVELLLARYDALLVEVGRDLDRPVGEIPVWSERDREVIAAANATERPVEPDTVLAAVARQVRSAPEAPAVRHGDRTTSYGSLWGAAEVTRDRLVAAGVRPGDVVALLLNRGPELAAAALGAWLAGAAYLPLEPNHPAQRISYQLADSGAKTLVAGAGAEAPEGCALLPPVDVDGAAPTTDPVVPAIDPDSAAYLIYTSGSTGRPKGIPIRHRSLANVITDYADRFGVARATGATAWLSTFSFDTSGIELFMPLISGGQVLVAPDEARSDGEAMLALLRDNDISFLQATPTTWRLVVDQVAGELAGLSVLSGGEPLTPELAARLVATGCRLWNVYGPTESTIWATAGEIGEPVERVDVGGPVANTRVFIAGPHGEELPIGVRGELCVAGIGVGSGYHDRPELTAAQFGEHPEHGRFYRSGDLARWLPDGRLDLLGRRDRQVKLRGNRIELGEVEAVLLGHPEVDAAAVVVVGDPSADGVLVAFVSVPRRPEVVGELWDHVHGLLPRSVVPHRFIPVEDFPKTGSDKVDYRALARIAAERATDTSDRPAADIGDQVVKQLVEFWCRLLERDDLDASSHFFASGGHSLLGATLAQEVKNSTGVRIKLADVFENPTPTSLASRIRALAAETGQQL
ncbi:amino acid adenylation domain-containing protein [Saccharopolyspora sp. NPDC000359]|uniref:non-ribosomal peptide synthetase n=1 Tax=Saccharopolyspora sp. NPDC000359 TaxID=3154251 RepID=UPI003327CC25